MNSEYERRMGHKLRRIRESQRKTQEQVSAQFQLHGCDLTRSALAKIEVGQRHIYPDEIQLFSLIYQIDYKELFPE